MCNDLAMPGTNVSRKYHVYLVATRWSGSAKKLSGAQNKKRKRDKDKDVGGLKKPLYCYRRLMMSRLP
jgi:hypothetical protein